MVHSKFTSFEVAAAAVVVVVVVVTDTHSFLLSQNCHPKYVIN